MYANNSANTGIYNDLMDALKRENKEIIEIQNSKPHKYGRYIKRIRENFLAPQKLLLKIRATHVANKIKKKYPRAVQNFTCDTNSNYFVGYMCCPNL